MRVVLLNPILKLKLYKNNTRIVLNYSYEYCAYNSTISNSRNKDIRLNRNRGIGHGLINNHININDEISTKISKLLNTKPTRKIERNIINKKPYAQHNNINIQHNERKKIVKSLNSIVKESKGDWNWINNAFEIHSEAQKKYNKWGTPTSMILSSLIKSVKSNTLKGDPLNYSKSLIIGWKLISNENNNFLTSRNLSLWFRLLNSARFSNIENQLNLKEIPVSTDDCINLLPKVKGSSALTRSVAILLYNRNQLNILQNSLFGKRLNSKIGEEFIPLNTQILYPLKLDGILELLNYSNSPDEIDKILDVFPIKQLDKWIAKPSFRSALFRARMRAKQSSLAFRLWNQWNSGVFHINSSSNIPFSFEFRNPKSFALESIELLSTLLIQKSKVARNEFEANSVFNIFRYLSHSLSSETCYSVLHMLSRLKLTDSIELISNELLLKKGIATRKVKRACVKYSILSLPPAKYSSIINISEEWYTALKYLKYVDVDDFDILEFSFENSINQKNNSLFDLDKSLSALILSLKTPSLLDQGLELMWRYSHGLGPRSLKSLISLQQMLPLLFVSWNPNEKSYWLDLSESRFNSRIIDSDFRNLFNYSNSDDKLESLEKISKKELAGNIIKLLKNDFDINAILKE